jgi:hypothetical protein
MLLTKNSEKIFGRLADPTFLFNQVRDAAAVNLLRVAHVGGFALCPEILR